MSGMPYMHLDTNKWIKELKTPLTNIKRIKGNSTVQAYINQRLRLTDYNQQSKGKELTTDTSYKSVLSKGSTKHLTQNITSISSKGNPKKLFEGSNSFVIRHKQRNHHSRQYMECLTQQLSPIKPLKDSSGRNAMEELRKENEMLKEEIKEYQKKIERLEKIINGYIAENTPIEISKCPKPMPLVYKSYEINCLVNDPLYYKNTIHDLSLTDSASMQL